MFFTLFRKIKKISSKKLRTAKKNEKFVHCGLKKLLQLINPKISLIFDFDDDDFL
jgi:hypothetical protein